MAHHSSATAHGEGLEKRTLSPRPARCSSSAASSLFDALKAEVPDINEEDLWNGSYEDHQRLYLQKKQQHELLQRLERRVGVTQADAGWHHRRRSHEHSHAASDSLPHSQRQSQEYQPQARRRSRGSADGRRHSQSRPSSANVVAHARSSNSFTTQAVSTNHTVHGAPTAGQDGNAVAHAVPTVQRAQLAYHNTCTASSTTNAAAQPSASPRQFGQSSSMPDGKLGHARDPDTAQYHSHHKSMAGLPDSHGCTQSPQCSPRVRQSPRSQEVLRGHTLYRDSAQTVMSQGMQLPPSRTVSDQDTGHTMAAQFAGLLQEVTPLVDTFEQSTSIEKSACAAPQDSGTATQQATTSHAAAEISANAEPAAAKPKDDAEPSDEWGDISNYGFLRRHAIQVCRNPDFENLVVAVIFANCITLMMYDPLQPDDSQWNRRLFWTELVFNIIFTVEMLVRIVASGGIWAYLQQPWNLFDAFMVTAGYTAFVPSDSGNTGAIRALRAMRALRPLRTITRFESLRGVVVCFLEAGPLLISVAGLLGFFLFVFAVAGTHLFAGLYNKACVNDITGQQEVTQADDPDMFGCGARKCPTGYTCMVLLKENAINVAGYNNVGYSFLSAFQALTLAGWVFMMYRAMDGIGGATSIYFILLVVLGAYFLLNLFLAVLKIKFAKAQTLFHAKMRAKKSKASKKSTIMQLFSSARSKLSEMSSKGSKASLLNSQLNSAMSSKLSRMSTRELPPDSPSKPNVAATELPPSAVAVVSAPLAEHTDTWKINGQAVVNGSPRTVYSAEVPGTQTPTAAAMKPGPVAEAVKFADEQDMAGPSPRHGTHHESTHPQSSGNSQSSAAGRRRRGVQFAQGVGEDDDSDEGDAAAPARHADAAVLAPVRISARGKQEHVEPPSPDTLYRPFSPNSKPAGGSVANGATGLLPSADSAMAMAGIAQDIAAVQPAKMQRLATDDAIGKGDTVVGPATLDGRTAVLMMSVEEFDEFVADQPFYKRTYLRAQFRLRVMVNANWFNQLFMLAIVANTLLLAMEHDGMPASMEHALSDANYAFTALFTTEMILKLMGLGFWDYVSDGFNLFDAVVVLISIIEIIMLAVGGLNGLAGMRALRILKALRVLRLFKLFKYLQSLRKIAEVLVTAFGSFAAILVLLTLFWLVFTIMGLHVFGGRELAPYDFPNWNTLLSSMIATFNVLNLENFQNLMYATTRANNMASSVFFVIWIIIGKYVLLTLFLAVTLEAFEAKYDSRGTGGVGTSMRSGMTSLLGSLRSGISSLRTSHRSVSPSHSPRKVVEPIKPAALPLPITAGEQRPAVGINLAAVKGWVDSAAENKQRKLSDSAGSESARGPGSRQASGRMKPDPNVTQHNPDGSLATSSAAKHAVNTVSSSTGRPVGEGTEQDLLDFPLSPSVLPDPRAAPGSLVDEHFQSQDGLIDYGSQLLQLLSPSYQQAARPATPNDILITRMPSTLQRTNMQLHRGMAPGHRLSQSSFREEPGSPAPSTGWESPVASTHHGRSTVTPDIIRPMFSPTPPEPRSPHASRPNPSISVRQAPAAVHLSSGVHWPASRMSQTALPAETMELDFVSRHHHDSHSSPVVGMSLANSTQQDKDLQNLSSTSRSVLTSDGSQQVANTSITEQPSFSNFDTRAFLISPLQQGQQTRMDAELSANVPEHSATAPATQAGFVHPEPQPLQAHFQTQLSLKQQAKQEPHAWPHSFDSTGNIMDAGGLIDFSPRTPQKDDATDNPGVDQEPMFSHVVQPAHESLGNNMSMLDFSTITQHSDHISGNSVLQDMKVQPLNASPRTQHKLQSRSSFQGIPIQSPVRTSLQVRHASASMLQDHPGGAEQSQSAWLNTSSASLPHAASISVSVVSDASSSNIDNVSHRRSSQTRLGTSSVGNPNITRRGIRRSLDEARLAADLAAGNASSISQVPEVSLIDALIQDLGLPGSGVSQSVTSPHVSQHQHHDRDTADMHVSSGSLPLEQQLLDRQLGEQPDQLAVGGPHPDWKSECLPPPSNDGDRSYRSYVSRDMSEASNDGQDNEHSHHKKKRRHEIPIEGTGKAFWIWDEDHPTREAVYAFVTHKYFDYFFFGIILLNCIAMALENPFVEDDSTLGRALFWSNIGFTIIFTLEVAVKSFAFTFRAYIKKLTNQIDFAIVISSFLDIALSSVTSNAGVINALRVLRAIKPLRMLTRSVGMRLVFKSVTMSLMAMANVSVVCVLFFIIFAILGTQLFSGRFWTCNDKSVAGKWECNGTFVDPATNVTVERQWHNQFPNFDHVGNSLMVCFITASLNGYTEIMEHAMSAPLEKDQQPHYMAQPGAFFWFVGFVIICSFTLLNLYVGVIFSQFTKIRMMSQHGSAFFTSEQTQWAELSKAVFRLKPPEKAQIPSTPLRRTCYHIINKPAFEYFVLATILVNVSFMTANWYGQPASWVKQQDQATYFFLSVYILEATLKIIALGWPAYIKSGWHKFDFSLVVLGIVDMVAKALAANFLRVLAIFRAQKLVAVLRIARFAKAAKSLKGIKSLFSTLVVSLPAFGNVGALVGLFFFMYAYLGVFLFGKVKFQSGINEHSNFRNFPNAVLTLLRVATGDNWVDVMYDAIVMPPDCEPELHNCGSYVALPYFLTFFLAISVILLNLFTAVIIETFEKVHDQEEWKLSPQALDDFVALWSEYDDGSGTIMPKHLEELLLKLDPPLGLGSFADSKDVLRFVYDLDIPLVNGRVPFHKTAFELVKRCSQANIPEGAIKEQIDAMIERFFKDLQQDEMLNFSVAVTVMKVQRKWRTIMRAAKLKRKRQWRDARAAAPAYSDLVSNRGGLPAKVSSYRSQLAVEQQKLEAHYLERDGHVDRAELSKKFQVRWKFSQKYAPFIPQEEPKHKRKPMEIARRERSFFASLATTFKKNAANRVAPLGQGSLHTDKCAVAVELEDKHTQDDGAIGHHEGLSTAPSDADQVVSAADKSSQRAGECHGWRTCRRSKA